MNLDTIFQPDTNMYAFETAIPSSYEVALEDLAPGVTTIVNEQKAPNESWYDSLARLLPMLASTYQQQQLLQVQVDRAKQGLPPLNTNQYAAGVNVGVSQDTQKMLMYGLIGVGALVIFSTMAKRR